MLRRLLVAAVLVTVGVVAVAATTPAAEETQPRALWTVQGDTWETVEAQCGATRTEIRHANYLGAQASVRIGAWIFCPLEPPPTTAPPTTAPPTTTTTTVEPTTTVASTTLPPVTTTTVAPTTTAPPVSGPQYVNTFDTAASFDALGVHVYHRNDDLYDGSSLDSGGTWQGDHDTACGPPSTKRTLAHTQDASQSQRRPNSTYWCPNAGGHFMSSMGDVDGYSIVAMWPNQTFAAVNSVCVDVSLTDLGTRQWFKIGVVTETLFNSTYQNWWGQPVPGFLMSDVGASDLNTSLAGPDRLIASWSGGVSAGYPGGMKIGNTSTATVSNPTPGNNMTRHPVCLTDNGDGTVTFAVAGVSAATAGAFPAGPVRAVLYQHAYTPSKSESGAWGTTMHWDNLIVN